ncbi:uncharacterized protein BO97DRAFT_421928 [Aspergillus homomorphus CBS 101889]|uniref:Cytochrome P450 n=1 Tax=Aspergillus homomorphus (strain CBS 101889) TaxID=1450537 RepID=A0A395I568_ASPHC|nr:hypothetical protein BO97DRAFT_421928 [Aspergillus homomorphus CBS 101889]RAL15137.1 hypothetical protein BO97DRAFT_421928 [Aspergillus homomorphus CBS 101889]
MASHFAVLYILLSLPFCVSYLVSWGLYHWANRHSSSRDVRLPPRLPAAIPILGHTIPFLFDSASFVTRVTAYAGKLSCVRISLSMTGIYLFQEPEAVAALWKHPLLSSPIFIYTVGLRYLFGMKDKPLETYTADDTGPFRRPHSGTNVAPHNRSINTQRLQMSLSPRHEPGHRHHPWRPMPDLLQFFRDHVGRAILESLLGPLLLNANPNFLATLWEFDEATPWLAKRLP